MDRRRFTLAALSAATVVGPAGLGSAIAQPAGTRDPLWFVNPELRPAARQIQAVAASFPPFSLATVPAARKGSAAFDQPPLNTVPFTKGAIKAPGGGPDVSVYVINAKPGTSRPGILHTHGGGFFMGSAAGDIRHLQETAAALDCAIVSVEYRLAPEATWSQSLEDNYAGLRWLHSHAGDIGVDPGRLAVMGESAGGGHAALLAIAARDRGEIQLAFQSLTYPMLDDRTGSSTPVEAPFGAVGWDAAANRFGWASFLGREPGKAGGPAGGVPARTASLAGLPPAWIGVGSIDLFLGEDVEYARRLMDAKVMVELLVCPGAFHGFDVIAENTPLAQQFKASRLEALRRALIA